MINKKSRIFVTGHKGLVGSAVVRRLKYFGFKKILTVDKKKLDLRNQQQVFNFLKQPGFFNTAIENHSLAVWDCCAASGGKSILLTDILKQKIELTVSDIRETILKNLHQRFKSAGIINYESFVTDLSLADNKTIAN